MAENFAIKEFQLKGHHILYGVIDIVQEIRRINFCQWEQVVKLMTKIWLYGGIQYCNNNGQLLEFHHNIIMFKHLCDF